MSKKQQPFRIGKLETAQDIFRENCRLFRRAAHGRVDPSDAAKLSGILANSRLILDTVILDQKLVVIEEQLARAVKARSQPILLNGAASDGDERIEASATN